jgi:hypothetical protein
MIEGQEIGNGGKEHAEGRSEGMQSITMVEN